MIVVLLTASAIFGEKVSMQDRAAASFPLPNDTPSISNGGLIVEDVNGYGKKVMLTFTNPGFYLVSGKNCGGGEMLSLGEFYWDPSKTQSSTNQVFDAVAYGNAMPYAALPCLLEVVFVGRGKIERSIVDVSSYQAQLPTTNSLKIQVIGESATKTGQYQITTGGLPKDAVVILGRGVLGSIQTNLGGSNIITFPPDAYLPNVGATTVTLCSQGRCGTSTYERKLQVSNFSPPTL